MFITLDGKYSVQKINMSISKHANLNWVRELQNLLVHSSVTDFGFYLFCCYMLV